MKIHRNNVIEFFTGSTEFSVQRRFMVVVEAQGIHCPCNNDHKYDATMQLYVGLDCVKYLLSNVQIMVMYRELRLGSNLKEFKNYYLLAEHFTTDPDEFPW